MHIEFWVILGLCLYCYNVECFSYINLGAIETVQWLGVSIQETSLRIWGCIPSTHKIIKWKFGVSKIDTWCLFLEEGADYVLVIPVISGLNEETLPQWLRRWRVTNKTLMSTFPFYTSYTYVHVQPHTHAPTHGTTYTHIAYTHTHIKKESNGYLNIVNGLCFN